MKPEIKNLAGGLAGAIVLNLIHEAAKRLYGKAPRIDLVGQEAVTKSLDAVGVQPPKGKALFGSVLAADIISNTVYYSMIGVGSHKNILLRGAGHGLAAGLGAIGLTQKLGLSDRPITKTDETRIMTVAWYMLGGLAAAFVISKISEMTKQDESVFHLL